MDFDCCLVGVLELGNPNVLATNRKSRFFGDSKEKRLRIVVAPLKRREHHAEHRELQLPQGI